MSNELFENKVPHAMQFLNFSFLLCLFRPNGIRPYDLETYYRVIDVIDRRDMNQQP